MKTEVPYGFCHCGCGQKTRIATQTRNNRGERKGEPRKFVYSHSPRVQKSSEERFWLKVDKSGGEDACWRWTGAHAINGYGLLWIKDKHVYAHRFSFILFNGGIADGMLVCHKCDNPICVNPKHLFSGTNNDNVQDKVNKGRSPKGDKHRSTILPDVKVAEIRYRYKSEGAKCSTLAKEYNMSRGYIYRIVKGTARI